MLGRDRRSGPEHQASLRRGQIAAWKRANAGEGFIYVAEVVGTNLVKVGFSLDPARRIRDWAGRAKLLGQFPASRAAERQFHRLHKAHAADGECYRRSYFLVEAPQTTTAIPQNCTWVGGISPADLDEKHPGEGAADETKPVKAQAAAPVGDTKSCGGGEGISAGCENTGDRLCTGRQPSPPPTSTIEACVRPATVEIPGPQDTIAAVGA